MRAIGEVSERPKEAMHDSYRAEGDIIKCVKRLVQETYQEVDYRRLDGLVQVLG